MSIKRSRPGLLAILAGLSLALGVPASVTVTTTQTYQTFEGMGVAPGMPTLYQKAGIFYQDRPLSYEYNRLCTDLGASGLRFFIDAGASYPAVGVYDWTGISGIVSTIRQCMQRGVNRYLITILNPPGWAKTNGIAELGGNLLPANYDNFSTYMAQLCKAFKDSTGVEPYAFCVQNEPAFAEPYGSCIYTDVNFSTLTSLTAPKLTALGLTTKLVGPEDVYSNGGLNWGTTKVNADLYAYAGHGDRAWIDVANYLNGTGKKMWMTEWDLGAGDVLGAAEYMRGATSMLSSLNNGLSWWTWLSNSNNLGASNKDANGVDTMWVPDKRYYSTKMFSRFIRPGAVRIGCTVTDANVAVTAFKNSDNSIAVIMINSGTGTVSEAIGGTGLPTTWHAYQTTASANCAYLGSSNGQSISLPALSVTSVTSAGQIPDIGVDTIPYRISAPTPDMTIGKLNAKGDDTLALWLNGVKISNIDAGTIQRQVAVKGLPDTNIIACRVVNFAWGGGFLGSMMLPGGDTLHTDGTWKVTYKNPMGNPLWNALNYNDASWNYAKDIGPVTIWPGFARWGSSAVSLYAQNAHWILGGVKTYFRKKITFTAAYTGIQIRGNNFNYKIYMDGVMLRQGTEYASCTNGCFTVPAVTAAASIASGSTHTIAFEVTDASTDGNGVLMKAGVTRAGSPMMMDTTWWCSEDSTAGWSTSAYTDTANWSHPDRIDAYDAGGGAGSFMYPGHFYFRKKFTSTQATMTLGNILNLQAPSRLVSVKYFTVSGREIKGGVRAMPRSMIIQRKLFENGKMVDTRMMQMH